MERAIIDYYLASRALAQLAMFFEFSHNHTDADCGGATVSAYNLGRELAAQAAICTMTFVDGLSTGQVDGSPSREG